MEVETTHYVVGACRVNWLWHVQDFWLPVVLPTGFSPKQALISDSEHHLNKIINIKYLKPQNLSNNTQLNLKNLLRRRKSQRKVPTSIIRQMIKKRDTSSILSILCCSFISAGIIEWVKYDKYLQMLRFLGCSLEKHLNNTKIHKFPLMDIEFCVPELPNNSLFRPIEEFPVSNLYQQPVILENAFGSASHQSSSSILLTLIDNTILLSDPNSQQVTPYAAVNFDFDLKFQVIHQTQKNIFSTKIGINLFYDQHKCFSFYSPFLHIVETWILTLSKKINRKGFHQMFKPFKKLGKGNFASVYEVERVTDHAKFAVKAFSKQSCFNAKNGKESLINELTIMRQLSTDNHPNVLKLEGVYESDNSIYVVLQLLTGGQLFHKIQQANGHFTATQVKDFMFGLLGGLKQMHSQRIMHRDLKPENIMLRESSTLTPVIVDFGLATNVDIEKYLFFRCGTPGYVAPEIIELSQSKHIEPECDIFSAGVMFHILLVRKAVFEGSKYEQVYKKNKEMNINLDGERYANVDPQAMDLLKKMLTSKPSQRVSASDALRHPFFEGMQSESDQKQYSPCLTKVSERRGNRILLK